MQEWKENWVRTTSTGAAVGKEDGQPSCDGGDGVKMADRKYQRKRQFGSSAVEGSFCKAM